MKKLFVIAGLMVAFCGTTYSMDFGTQRMLNAHLGGGNCPDIVEFIRNNNVSVSSLSQDQVERLNKVDANGFCVLQYLLFNADSMSLGEGKFCYTLLQDLIKHKKIDLDITHNGVSIIDILDEPSLQRKRSWLSYLRGEERRPYREKLNTICAGLQPKIQAHQSSLSPSNIRSRRLIYLLLAGTGVGMLAGLCVWYFRNTAPSQDEKVDGQKTVDNKNKIV